MSDVVNLNRFRKAKAKAEKSAKATTNRSKFGRTKAEKSRDKAEGERVRLLLDGAKRDENPNGGPE